MVESCGFLGGSDEDQYEVYWNRLEKRSGMLTWSDNLARLDNQFPGVIDTQATSCRVRRFPRFSIRRAVGCIGRNRPQVEVVSRDFEHEAGGKFR